jgi:hypothetical protein
MEQAVSMHVYKPMYSGVILSHVFELTWMRFRLVKEFIGFFYL